jgi:hypothetical protein
LFDILKPINPHDLAVLVHRSLAAYLFILLISFSPLSLWGQIPAATPSGATTVLNFKPIDVRFTTVDGLTYSLGDDALKSYQDFHEVMDPLKDFETQRLINRSASSQETSNILRMVGLIGWRLV